MKERWLGLYIVWSALIPRRVWRAECDPKCIDQAQGRGLTVKSIWVQLFSIRTLGLSIWNCVRVMGVLYVCQK